MPGRKLKGRNLPISNITRKAKAKQPVRIDSNALKTQLLEVDNEIMELKGLLSKLSATILRPNSQQSWKPNKIKLPHIRESLNLAKEQEKEHPEAAALDEKGRPLPPNCVILRSKKFGGIKYEYLKPELIPEGSFEHQTEWLNRRMHWLVSEGFDANKQEKFKAFEVPDEIKEYPAKLLDTIKAEPIKEFLKMDKGMLEKVAVWACVAVILGCMFIGFVTVTQPKQVKASTGQLTPVTQPVLTPINSTTTTTTATTTTGGK